MILLAKMVADEDAFYQGGAASSHCTPAPIKALPFSVAMPALW